MKNDQISKTNPSHQRSAILAALVKNGWVPYDLNGGIAAKAFSTDLAYEAEKREREAEKRSRTQKIRG